MANPTSNFGWQMPTNTDLVKDLPADFEVFGQAVDTSLMDLKGGTTGQVLSKASNTDMDFTWVAQDDSNAIQNALLTTTGDTIYASGASTPARLGIGTTGQVLTVSAGGIPSWATSSSGGETSLASGSFPTNSGVLSLSSISGSYNYLRLELRNWTGGTGGGPLLRFNSNTGSVYSRMWTTGGAYTQTNSATSIGSILDLSHTNRLDVIYVYNYAGNSQKFIQWFTSGNVTAGNTVLLSGTFNSTTAITSLSIDNSSNGFYTAGTYVLYGVK